MRIVLLTILAFLMLFEPPYTCFYFGDRVPKEAYPEKIGDFRRETETGPVYSTFFTNYFNPNRPRLHSIRLEAVIPENEPEGYLDLSERKCSKENIENSLSNAKLLKQNDLKDKKTGKKVGVIRICTDKEQDADNFYVEMTNGKILIYLRTNNLKGETGKTENLTLDELLEFTKNVPLNLTVDF
jgi:hypothetical protein